MPTNYYKRQGILQGILKALSHDKNKEGVFYDSNNLERDQQQFTKLLKTRGRDDVVVRKFGSKLFFWKR